MSQTVVFVVLFLSVLQTYLSADEEPSLLTKLDCQPAEKRIFIYESNTQLFGPLDENFVVSADVIIHCLGTDNNGNYGTDGLKYMVQIQNLKPSVVKEKQNEIAKQKRRVKRGAVGSWFKQAWVDVKDFFVNLFTKKKRNDNEFDFDLEKQPSMSQYQCRAKRTGDRIKRAAKPEPVNYDNMFSTPFVFIQLSDGTIPEVRFSDKDSDPTVKNFKKHIADTFATQLDASKRRVLEKSPIGEHFSTYSYDNTGKINESLRPTSDGQSLKLSASFMALSQVKEITQLSVMRDVSPNDLMEIGSGNSISYDSSQIGVNAKQIQQISEGRVTTTAGHLSLSLVNPTKSSRSKRNAEPNEELEDYLKVRTKYSLSLTKRIAKRSTDDKQSLQTLKDMESKLNLKGEALISESTAENTFKEKLLNTKKFIKKSLEDKNADSLVQLSSDQQSPIYNSLMKALNLEVMLNEDKTDSSMTHTINDKITEKNVRDICGQKISIKNKNCLDLMLILIKSQSTIAQNLLISQLKSDVSLDDKNEILKLLVQLPNPQNSLISQLLDLLKTQTNRNSNYEGMLLLAISNLGFHSQSAELRAKIADILINKLKQMKCGSEDDNSLLIDTLEALGNLGHKSTIPIIKQFGDSCLQSESIRVGAIHSGRRLLTSSEIQKWFLKLLKEPDNSCVIKQEVVNTLIEDINAIDMELKSVNRWPKTEFNEIDNVLTENLIQIKHNECLQQNIIRYFERKSNIQSKIILRKAKKNRSKRAVFDSFWTESSCKEWVPGSDKKEPAENQDSVIVSDKIRESEDTDQTLFQKRRKCTATKRFGPNQAQAVFRADIVNDVSGSNDKQDYKLMAQFVAGTHFLGKDIDIGKMYVYHKKDASRAYVNMFGNTLVDATTSECNGTTLQPYRTSNYLPLYDFSLWIVQMTLGVRMNAEMNFDLPNFNCDPTKAQQLQIVDFSPGTEVRAAGEVSGKVLVIKGGMNIGGDFNYFSNLKFDPSPELCLSVYNGYKPMNVSINSWYQFWHPSCSEWMDKTIWSPPSLNWQINDHHRSAWLENECLIRDSNLKSKNIDP